ncbi:hypothetical protein ANRL3_02514 [Anaerolineae bacterium]|nr:hypothetical protein ANRL3_02514 [Anaerolineae bacterium]
MKIQNRIMFFYLFAATITLALTAASCRVGLWSSPTARELTKSNLVGTYELPPYFIGKPTTLRLKSDDTFEMIAPKSIPQEGTWQLDGNRISLTYQGQDSIKARLVGFVSHNERGFYLVLWREGDDPDDADVFVPPW